METGRQGIRFTQTIIWTLAAVMLVMGSGLPESMAMLAPPEVTSSGTDTASNRTDELQLVQRVLENKMVRQRLADLGFTSEEINNRLAAVSDAQLHELAMQIDALVPGGDLDGLLGTILTIALIVLVVVVILILI